MNLPNLSDKCKMCGKRYGKHNTLTEACPLGTRTRVGYSFHRAQFFKAVTEKSKKEKPPVKTKWRPMKTAPKDGTEILLMTRRGVVSARFCYEPADNLDKDNAVCDWICYDDKFTVGGGPDDTEAIKWMPIPP